MNLTEAAAVETGRVETERAGKGVTAYWEGDSWFLEAPAIVLDVMGVEGYEGPNLASLLALAERDLRTLRAGR